MYNRRNINDKVYNRRSNSVSGNYPNKQTKLSCPGKTNIESEYRNLRVNRSGTVYNNYVVILTPSRISYLFYKI